MQRFVAVLLISIVMSSLSSLGVVSALAAPTPDPAQGASTGLTETAEPTPDAALGLTLTVEALPRFTLYFPAMFCYAPAASVGQPCDSTSATPTPLTTATSSPTSTFVPTAPTGTPTPIPTVPEP